MIEKKRNGGAAYQIGGFALVGSRLAHPDIALTHYGENSAVIRDLIAAALDFFNNQIEADEIHCSVS